MADEYAADPPEGWRPSAHKASAGDESDLEYQHRHGLDLRQMYWRDLKIGSSQRPAWMDMRPSHRSIRAQLRRRGLPAPGLVHQPDARLGGAATLALRQPGAQSPALIIGCDCGREHGNGRTAILRRRDVRQYGLEVYRNWSHEQIAYRLRDIVNEERPALVCVDEGDVGQAVCTLLRGWSDTRAVLRSVGFGRRAPNPVRFPELALANVGELSGLASGRCGHSRR